MARLGRRGVAVKDVCEVWRGEAGLGKAGRGEAWPSKMCARRGVAGHGWARPGRQHKEQNMEARVAEAETRTNIRKEAVAELMRLPTRAGTLEPAAVAGVVHDRRHGLARLFRLGGFGCR